MNFKTESHFASTAYRLVTVSLFLMGCFFTARSLQPDMPSTMASASAEIQSSSSPRAADAGETHSLSKSSVELATTNIEDIRLGQRVVGTNPLREQTQPASDINPETWRAVELVMHEAGIQYDLAFLRPLAWIEATRAVEGGMIHLELDEMGLNGPAQVTAINPCPEIEPDDGTGRNVVTGTMAHPGPNILYLDITGLDEPLGVTDTHPIWSETRQDFVKAGQLKVGEQFRPLTGESATLTKIHPHRGPPELVFNLEVDGEHVYSVAGNGLLVHNDCADLYRAVSPEEFADIRKTGNFNLHPNAMGVKQFGHDLDEVLQLADEVIPDAAAVVKTTVPRSVFDALDHTHVDSSTLTSGATTVYRELLDFFNQNKTAVQQVF